MNDIAKNNIPERTPGVSFDYKKSKTSSAAVKAKDSNSSLKKGIWLYFLLLIFEGALRKWVLPGLATPLLVIRDPIAVWLVITAFKRGLLPPNPYLIGMFAIGILGTLTSVAFGHGSLFVAIFGARPLLINFPLIFVIGKVFNRDDVVSIGKVTLWLAIPIAVLVALQFYSPQSALVNRSVGGGEEGAGFSGAMGFFRPPGTFSFTNGNTMFYNLVACFVFYFWLNQKNVNRIILIGATVGLLIVIPLSISRGLLLSVCVILIFVVLASARKPAFLSKMIVALIGVGFFSLILSQFQFLQTAMLAFTSRFETAALHEGGLSVTLGDRYLGGLIGAFSYDASIPFFGNGLGLYTNVGTMLLSGNIQKGISEGEWGRMIAELGPLLGVTGIIIRLLLSLKLAIMSYQKLSNNDVLPWILLAFCLLTFPQGNWAQPTALGFCTVLPGLVLAALNGPVNKSAGMIAPDQIKKAFPVNSNSRFGRIR